VVGAIRLDAATYAEVAGDAGATKQSFSVTAAGGGSATVQGIVDAIVLPLSGTDADVRRVRRCQHCGDESPRLGI
jgi:hypothetical protein